MLLLTCTLFALCGCLSGVIGAPEPCCVPAQWEANMDQLIGSSLPRPIGDIGIVQLQDGHIWFDAPHNRIAIKVTQEVRVAGQTLKQEVIVIQNFTTKMQTTILPAQKNCLTTPTATDKIHQCLNETNATFVKALEFGGSLDAYMWKSNVDNQQQHLEVFLTTSKGSCLPITNAYFGSIESNGEQIPIQGSMLYSDITPGLKDTGIFKIPYYCAESSGIGYEDTALSVKRLYGFLF